MTEREMHDVMTYIFADHGAEITNSKRAVWFDQFKHVSFETAIVAARALVSRKQYGLPKVHDFAIALKEVSQPLEMRRTWNEEFSIWVKIARRCGYTNKAEAKREYARVCPKGFQALGTMADDWFDIEVSERATFRAQFRMSFEAIDDRDDRLDLLPPDVVKHVQRIDRASKPELASDVLKRLGGALVALPAAQTEGAK